MKATDTLQDAYDEGREDGLSSDYVCQLVKIANAARAHRATIHMRLHPTAVNKTGEDLDAALDALDEVHEAGRNTTSAKVQEP